MKLRILFLLLTIISSTAWVQAQSSRAWRAADAAFESMQYTTAANKYKKALSKAKSKPDKELISFKMAECYRYMNNTRRAEAGYKRILKTKYAEEHPILYLYYAQALKTNEKFDEAKIWFEKYAEFVPADPRGKNGAESCDLAKDWLENPTKVEVKNVKQLNSRESDFSPTFADKTGNTLIFTSTRDASTGKSVDNWTGQSFSDLFISKLDPRGNWSTPVLLETGGLINTEANEGNPMMNSKYNQLYFVRCGNESGTLQGCQIMVARRTGRAFGEPKALDLGGDSTTVFGNPSISPDELMLFFSAELKGGKGGKDIWIATRKSPNEKFGRPQNLGSFVNTSGDEMFPYMRNDSTLYFSSNGHPGMGGLDIFRASLVDGEWKDVVNLQAPMNSTGDDFGIIYMEDEDQGYFCSNRKGGRGGDDIWSFYNPPILYTLSGTVKDDKTLQPIQGVVVRLTGSDGSTIEARTNDKGGYSFNKNQIKKKTSYELIALKNNYFNKKAKETTVGLESSKDFVINFMLEPMPDKPVVLPDILYDLAKWDLKPQYQDSLQGLIRTLDENETIIVELASHTDNRGSEESNDILSQKRAESVVDYLIERGIDPNRLVAKGYGEHIPRTLAKTTVKDGFTFKAGTVLTPSFIDSLPGRAMQEAAHALNRRTEFRILSKDFVPKQKNVDIKSQTQKVSIQINPDDNSVPFTENADKTISFPAVVNGITMNITLGDAVNDLSFSQEQTLKLLKDGAIGKTNFQGDAAKILGDNTVADQAVFTVSEINISKKSRVELEATVVHKQKVPVMMSEKLLKKFGDYTLDQANKKIIFK